MTYKFEASTKPLFWPDPGLPHLIFVGVLPLAVAEVTSMWEQLVYYMTSHVRRGCKLLVFLGKKKHDQFRWVWQQPNKT